MTGTDASQGAEAAEKRLRQAVATLDTVVADLDDLVVATQRPLDLVDALAELAGVVERLHGLVALGRLFNVPVEVAWDADDGDDGPGWAYEWAATGTRLAAWQTDAAGAARRAVVLGLTRRTTSEGGHTTWTRP